MLVFAAITPHPPLVIPGIGQEQDREQVKATINAFERLGERLREAHPEVVVVISPHAPTAGRGFLVNAGVELRGDLGEFGLETGDLFHFKGEVELGQELTRAAREQGLEAERVEGRLDYATLVPLYYLLGPEQERDTAAKKREKHKALKKPALIVISLAWAGPQEHWQMGQALGRVLAQTDKRVALVASGDLSHRLTPDAPAGWAEEGELFDKTLIGLLEEGDAAGVLSLDENLVERAGECGWRSVVMLLGALEGRGYKFEKLSYEGPFGVGYLVALLEKADADYDEADPYTALARQTAELYLRQGKKPGGEQDWPPELGERRAGVFVTVDNGEELRGCIGTVAATQDNLAREIIENTVAAITSDTRFRPITADELEQLRFEVSILGELQPVANRTELDPRRLGVYVKTPDGRAGLLLPDLEGVDMVEQQLEIAAAKGGIEADEDYSILAFSVEKYEETGEKSAKTD